MWFKLNCKTRISVVTPVGESDAARFFDSIGQGSFGAALASSLSMGTAIYEGTKDETLTKLGLMPVSYISGRYSPAKHHPGSSQERSYNYWRNLGKKN